MAEIAKCIPKSLVSERQVHPDAVMVEWRPETQDLVEELALECLPIEHPKENTYTPPDSPSTSR
jgi:hypothetical protein